MPIIGDAGFEYTPNGGSLTQVELGAPAYFETYGRRKRRYIHQPLDYSVSPDRVTIGTHRREVSALFRFHEDPEALVEMLSEGADDGIALTYYPSLADTGTSYDFTVVEVGEVVEVQRDRDFPDTFFQRWEVTIRLATSDDISDLVTPA